MSHTRMVAPLHLLLELCPFDYFLRISLQPHNYVTLWNVMIKANSNVH